MRSGGDRRARAVAALATALVLASGCGFLQDLADPDEAPSIPVADPATADQTPAVETLAPARSSSSRANC